MLLEEFNRVLMPHQGKMFGFAKSLMRTREDAEDVVQDIFLKVWKHREKLSQIENMEAYLMRAVRNTALNRLEKGKRKWEELSNGQEVPSGIDPQLWVEGMEAKELIGKLIENLPMKQRTIFKLKEVEHYEVEQIAELLETDINNVRVNLSVARKKMKEAYNRILKHEI